MMTKQDMTKQDLKAKQDMAAVDNDAFEQGKLVRFNREPRNNPYPEDSEQHARWEAGYKFIEQGLVAV